MGVIRGEIAGASHLLSTGLQLLAAAGTSILPGGDLDGLDPDSLDPKPKSFLGLGDQRRDRQAQDMKRGRPGRARTVSRRAEVRTAQKHLPH